MLEAETFLGFPGIKGAGSVGGSHAKNPRRVEVNGPKGYRKRAGRTEDNFTLEGAVVGGTHPVNKRWRTQGGMVLPLPDDSRPADDWDGEENRSPSWSLSPSVSTKRLDQNVYSFGSEAYLH